MKRPTRTIASVAAISATIALAPIYLAPAGATDSIAPQAVTAANGTYRSDPVNAVIGTIDGCLGVYDITALDDTVYVPCPAASSGDDTVAIISAVTQLGAMPSIVGSVVVGQNPYGIVTSDDTVYVSNNASSSVSAFGVANPPAVADDTLAVESFPGPIAVGTRDDTVFVGIVPSSGGARIARFGADQVPGAAPLTTVIPVTTPGFLNTQFWSIAANDDSVFVPNPGDDSIVSINGGTGALVSASTSGVVSRPTYAAVRGSSLYVVGNPSSTVFPLGHFDSATLTPVGPSVVVAGAGRMIVDDTTVYISGTNGIFTWVNRATMTVDDTVQLPSNAGALGVTRSGLIFAGGGATNVVYVLSPVDASVTTSSAREGDTVTVTVTSRIANGPTPDQSTLSSLTLNGEAISFVATATPGVYEITIPAGATSGPLVASFRGGNSGTIVPNFTIGGDNPPPPPPSTPPSPPVDVTAVPGNGQATISWSPPANPGSFPVTTYRVIAEPGGQSCLVAAPALTCTITGLTNGTAYTFTVEALNGAGWSLPSAASSPVTPTPGPAPIVSITLDQGTRSPEGRHDRISTTGDTRGIDPGVRLTPWIRYAGQTKFAQGRATIVVQSDGTFRWKRLISKSRNLVAYVSWTDVESNRVRWAKVR